MSRRMSQAMDAPVPFPFTLLQPHVDKAVPRNCDKCALVLGAKSAGCTDALVLRNFVYLKRKGKWWRYVAGAAAKVIIALIDKGNKRQMKLPVGGLRIVLEVPEGVRTLAYRRSPEFAAMRKASYLKNKNKPVRRTYRGTDGVSLEDIRNGTGAWV